MIVKVNDKSYIVRFSRSLYERESKCLDKWHRRVTINWDELTVECTISEVYKRDRVQKVTQYKGIATSSYLDVLSMPVGRMIALKRAVSQIGLDPDQVGHFLEEVGKQVKLKTASIARSAPKAYVEMKFIVPEDKETRMKARLARKAENDKKRKEIGVAEPTKGSAPEVV